MKCDSEDRFLWCFICAEQRNRCAAETGEVFLGLDGDKHREVDTHTARIAVRIAYHLCSTFYSTLQDSQYQYATTLERINSTLGDYLVNPHFAFLSYSMD